MYCMYATSYNTRYTIKGGGGWGVAQRFVFFVFPFKAAVDIGE
jgi:hypothetical protein